MTIKICATCKHLKVLEQKREFEHIVDTEYTLFQCEVFECKIKEFYLMAPVKEELKDNNDFMCEFWKDWRS